MTCQLDGRTVLLDTNVWSYIADQQGASDLQRIAEEHCLELLVSPAVVLEQLKLRDHERRRLLLKVTTSETWTRLMPEAYVACAELVAVASKRRPDWIIDRPTGTALAKYRLNKSDWEKGFWTRVRNAPDRQGVDEATAAAAASEIARAGEVARSGGLTLDTFRLGDPRFCDVFIESENGQQRRVEVWRVSSANHMAMGLLGPLANGTFQDWLEPFIDWRVAEDRHAFVEFWLEVDAAEVPTHWVWWASAALAPLVRQNDGTAVDVQIGSYLTRSDVFLTADKRLHRIASKIAAESPVHIAEAVRTSSETWREDLAALSSRPTP